MKRQKPCDAIWNCLSNMTVSGDFMEWDPIIGKDWTEKNVTQPGDIIMNEYLPFIRNLKKLLIRLPMYHILEIGKALRIYADKSDLSGFISWYGERNMIKYSYYVYDSKYSLDDDVIYYISTH